MDQNIEASPSGKIENNVVLPYVFSIRKSISEAWARVSGFKATCWGALLISFLLQLGLSFIGMLIVYFAVGSLNNTHPGVEAYKGIVNAIVFLASFPLYFGFYFLGIKRSANLPVKSKMIFQAYRFYWRLLGVIIVQYILMLITAVVIGGIVFGLVLINSFHIAIGIDIVLTVIGIIIGLIVLYILFGLILFPPYLVMDKNVGVFKSFKLSFQGFKQHGIKIFINFFIIGIIVMLSMIPFGIGLIWTIPLSIAQIGVIYRTLFGVTLVLNN